MYKIFDIPCYYFKSEVKVECEALPHNTYFMLGYQDESLKDHAYLCHWDNGTCLTPLFHPDGTPVVIPGYTGKTLTRYKREGPVIRD